jgi:hypothetical protein
MKDKYLDTAKKFVELLEDLNKIDNKIDIKFKNNEKDIKFCNTLQNNTNNYFSTIIKNLKDLV